MARRIHALNFVFDSMNHVIAWPDENGCRDDIRHVDPSKTLFDVEAGDEIESPKLGRLAVEAVYVYRSSPVVESHSPGLEVKNGREWLEAEF